MTIPFLSGVPPLKQALTRNLISTGSVALIDATVASVKQKWGVYDSKGNKALNPDSFISVDYRNGSRLSNYPVEPNSFSTYNKVPTPYAASVLMAMGGATPSKAAFLKAAQALANDLKLYTIVTPEENFVNANVERISYERRAGLTANLILVRLHFVEMRVTTSIRYSQTRSGKQVQSSVPVSQQTTPTTSSGLPSTLALKNPGASGATHNGAVSTISRTISTGTIQ